MTREDARYYLQSSGFSEEQINTIEQAFMQEPCEPVGNSDKLDCIRRQAVIDALYDWSNHSMTDAETWHIRQVIGDIKSNGFKAQEPKTEWIPVSERLPEPYEQVLRTVKSFGWNCTDKTYVDIDSICPADTDVIAWMPLPEPFKESEVSE